MLLKSSAVSIFSVIYQIQIILLLPLANKHMHDNVIYFQRALKFMLFNFSVMPDSMNFMSSATDSSHFENSNWYLYAMGFESGSSVTNLGKYLVVFIIYISIIAIFGCFYLYTFRFEADSLGRVRMKKIMDVVALKSMIRFILASYIFFLLISLPEVSGMYDESGSLGSLLTAYTMLSICLAIFSVALIEWFRFMKQSTRGKAVIFRELFNGLNDSNYARFYPVLWITRRIMFVVVLTCFGSLLSGVAKLCILLAGQFTYLLYFFGGKVMVHGKDKAFEIINEVGILFCIIVTVVGDDKATWSTSVTTIYIVAILACNSLVMLISIGKYSLK